MDKEAELEPRRKLKKDSVGVWLAVVALIDLVRHLECCCWSDPVIEAEGESSFIKSSGCMRRGIREVAAHDEFETVEKVVAPLPAAVAELHITTVAPIGVGQRADPERAVLIIREAAGLAPR